VVETCGDQWRECHGDGEVRQMRDIHIEALARQYGGNEDLGDCQVVRELRESGRSTADQGDDVQCSDSRTTEIQKQFQNCSHEISTAVYEESLDMFSPSKITYKLCKALSDIGSICVNHLKQCFATEDVKQMRKSSLEEMKEFLIRIVDGKVTSDSLNACKALDQVNYEDQGEEEDSPELITAQQEEKTTAPSETVTMTPEITTTTTTTANNKEHRSVEMGEVNESGENVEDVTEHVEEVTEKQFIEEVDNKVEEVNQNKEEVKENQDHIASTSAQHVKWSPKDDNSGAEGVNIISLVMLIGVLVFHW